MQSVSILRSLNKTKFHKILYKTEEECIICWNDYKPEDDVIKLKCNDKHYFHSHCIEDWIKSGNNSCPLCREPIVKDRNSRASEL